MFECKPRGCTFIATSGYWVVAAQIEALGLQGRYCTYCHGFWPTTSPDEIDPNIGTNVREYLAAAGFNPDEEDHRITILDTEYLRVLAAQREERDKVRRLKVEGFGKSSCR